jgi:hypothetical protein
MKHLILAGLMLIPTLCLASDNDSYRHEDSDNSGESKRSANVINYTDKDGSFAGSETRYSNGKTEFIYKDGEIIGIINKDSD